MGVPSADGARIVPFRIEARRAHFGAVPQLRPLYSPARALFACPALLSLAARAGLGGARETLLGAVMAARLAAALRGPFALDDAARQARAEGARQWLGAITLPPKARTALLRSFAATAQGDPVGAADALEAVTEVTSPHLDRVARSELVRLVTALRARPGELAGDGERPVE